MLLHIPELLAGEALARAQALLARTTWVDGRITAGAQAATVKNNQQVAAGSAELPELQSIVLAALERHPLFFSAALPKRVLPPFFNRYGGSANAYGAHVDQAIRYHPDGAQRVRTDVSCTLFLADPADYEGGELVIQDTYGAPRIKLPAGDLVLYPGTSVHRVEPVRSGFRVASVFWIESLVRSDEQRRLLHEMDMALLRLRSRHGETEEAVALTGTYHNLLRLWADT